MNATAQDTEIDRLARKRAGAKLGWYVHAGIYLAVNLMLAAIAASSGRHWAVFPAFGWGIGLLAHAAIVFVVTGGAGLHEKLVQRERQRLQLQRDPW
jgi:hypothetical protein